MVGKQKSPQPQKQPVCTGVKSGITILSIWHKSTRRIERIWCKLPVYKVKSKHAVPAHKIDREISLDTTILSKDIVVLTFIALARFLQKKRSTKLVGSRREEEGKPFCQKQKEKSTIDQGHCGSHLFDRFGRSPSGQT